MDVEQGATLALQILALGSIVAALLVYLIRQSRNTDEEYEIRSKRHVLITSCDTCIGLQIALSLSEAGYKVIILSEFESYIIMYMSLHFYIYVYITVT